MKKILLFVLTLSLGGVLSSCEGDGPYSKVKVNFRRANIAGAEMLAIAQNATTKTRAEGDITVGPKALYSVSEDGTMVRVSYDVEVEGVDGKVE